jgi:hypothetical protein
LTAALRSSRLAVSRLVELAGPAGAGKSTVFRALVTRADNVEAAPDIGKRDYALLAAHVPPVVGALLRRRAIRRLTPAQLRVMVYLRALPPLVARRPPGDRSVLIFDQGPLYVLGRPRLLDARLAPWRQEMFERWASLLDAVVWLDAPDGVLVGRIGERPKWHRLKGQPADAAIDVLAKTRAVYEEMLSNLEARDDGPGILRFDTSRTSPEEIADAVLGAVDGTAFRAGDLRA